MRGAIKSSKSPTWFLALISLECCQVKKIGTKRSNRVSKMTCHSPKLTLCRRFQRDTRSLFFKSRFRSDFQRCRRYQRNFPSPMKINSSSSYLAIHFYILANLASSGYLVKRPHSFSLCFSYLGGLLDKKSSFISWSGNTIGWHVLRAS